MKKNLPPTQDWPSYIRPSHSNTYSQKLPTIFRNLSLRNLAAFFKHLILYKTNNPKQSCNPHPLLYSTLAFSSLPLESEQSVSTWIDKGRDEKARVEGGGCNFVLDNCYACCVLFFCLSLPQKIFLSFPYPHKEKKGRTQ
jgi:hypothetical protein